MNDIKRDWDSMAQAYEEFNNAKDSYSYNIEWPCIRKLLPDLKGKTVVDLGCGTGIFTFLLEQDNPLEIIGIDLSEEMLQIAKDKAKKNKSRANFVLYDAARCANVIEKPVDFIFSSTTSHYIEDLELLFDNVSRSLKEEGESIFSVIHPVYSAMYPIAHGNIFPKDEEWTVRYLDRSTRAYIQPWIEYNEALENHLSKSCHHTFADYVNAITGAGLAIEQICEPMAPEQWKVSEPDRYEGFLETPVYMIFKMKKR